MADRGSVDAIRPITGTGLRVARNVRVLLDIAEMSLSGAKLVAVVGPNGAGKSMLMKVLAGVMEPDHGEVRWAGRAPNRRDRIRLSLLLQSPVVLRRSVIANVDFALRAAGLPAGRERARAVLDGAKLGNLADTPARRLSGGEMQRLALARALAIGPEVLILDEPTANLDPASVLAIESMVGQARAGGATVVLVTHDLAQARRLADDVIFMLDGRIVERSAASDFLSAPRSQEARAFVAGEIVIGKKDGETQ